MALATYVSGKRGSQELFRGKMLNSPLYSASPEPLLFYGLCNDKPEKVYGQLLLRPGKARLLTDIYSHRQSKSTLSRHYQPRL
jgi:hypothetical protein